MQHPFTIRSVIPPSSTADEMSLLSREANLSSLLCILPHSSFHGLGPHNLPLLFTLSTSPFPIHHSPSQPTGSAIFSFKNPLLSPHFSAAHSPSLLHGLCPHLLIPTPVRPTLIPSNPYHLYPDHSKGHLADSDSVHHSLPAFGFHGAKSPDLPPNPLAFPALSPCWFLLCYISKC